MSSPLTNSLSSSLPGSPLTGDWRKYSPIRVIRKVARFASLSLVLYWLALFAGTHIPGGSVPSVEVSDKLLHAVAYAGLSFLLAWAIPNWGKGLSHVGWAAGIAFAYGCIDELTQMLVPSRSCEIADLAADTVGIVCGITCYLILRWMLQRVGWGRTVLRGLSR